MNGIAATAKMTSLKYDMLAAKLVVGQQQLASALRDDREQLRLHKVLQTPDGRLSDHQITAVRLQPQRFPLRVVDKHIRRSGRIGTVFEVIEPAIEQQRRAIRIKKNRGESVVVMIHDQLPGGRSE